MSRYAKTLAAVVAAGLAGLFAVLSDDVVTPREWVFVAIQAVGALGVYAIPNRPPGPLE